MNKLHYFLLNVLAVLMITGNLQAEITLPRIIGNNMVLQRGQPVPIWGQAAAGEQVTVTFGKQSKQATADNQGNWKVMLDVLKASDKPASMTIAGKNTIVLNNILVGEVWICSGQSNMEYAMRKIIKVSPPKDGREYPKDEAETASNDNLRIFLVVRKTLNRPSPSHTDWSAARDSALRSFSAAGYFFAKELNKQLKVPVGIISSAVSGSRIEPWIPEEGFAASDFFNNPDSAKRVKPQGDPGKFYVSMIAPLAPFAIKGFLWYQGETNCFLNETIAYTRKMEVLINSWRSAWKDDQLPFYYTQIAPFNYSKSKSTAAVLTEATEPEFREAQALAMNIPNTGMIITTDLSDNLEDIHPSYKWEIGRRLALWALAKTYGEKKLVYSGPMYGRMKIKGNKIEIEFNHTGSGLTTKDGKAPDWFMIAGADHRFVPAEAVIENNKLVVSSSSIASPVAVRFAWNEAAQSNLINKEGLPASPFRTDTELKWVSSINK